jgi:hypothetical protein
LARNEHDDDAASVGEPAAIVSANFSHPRRDVGRQRSEPQGIDDLRTLAEGILMGACLPARRKLAPGKCARLACAAR